MRVACVLGSVGWYARFQEDNEKLAKTKEERLKANRSTLTGRYIIVSQKSKIF